MPQTALMSTHLQEAMTASETRVERVTLQTSTVMGTGTVVVMGQTGIRTGGRDRCDGGGSRDYVRACESRPLKNRTTW